MRFHCEQKKIITDSSIKATAKILCRSDSQTFFFIIIQKMMCLPFCFLLSLCFKLKSIFGVAAVTSKFIQQDSGIILFYTKIDVSYKSYLSLKCGFCELCFTMKFKIRHFMVFVSRPSS